MPKEEIDKTIKKLCENIIGKIEVESCEEIVDLANALAALIIARANWTAAMDNIIETLSEKINEFTDSLYDRRKTKLFVRIKKHR